MMMMVTVMVMMVMMLMMMLMMIVMLLMMIMMIILGGLGSNLGCLAWEGLGEVLGGLGAHFGGSVAQLGAYMADESKKSGDRQNPYSILATKSVSQRAHQGRQREAKGSPNRTKMRTKNA